MQRRKFLKAAGIGAAASVVAAPAIAQSMPEVKWRMTSSFPKSLDTLFGGAEVLAKRVAEATDNKFQIQVFAGGEIVPALQALDAAQAGTVEAAHTASYYYIGKDPTFAFATAIPFGPNTRQHNAWMYHGGGIEAMNEFYKEYNVIGIPAGNTCGQMGGWFRKEIKTLDDLKGLKYRIGGFAGQVVSKLGVVPQQIAGGDIYPALEKGTVDAAEWVGPYDDEKLGFNKIAKFYYYPGWWEGSAGLTAMFNLGAWQKLPKNYQAIVEAACSEANNWMASKYDALNPAALRKLIAGGTQLRSFPREVMEACYNSAQQLYAETNEKNPKFKKIYDQWRDFRNSQLEWFRVTENSFDQWMMTKSRERKV